MSKLLEWNKRRQLVLDPVKFGFEANAIQYIGDPIGPKPRFCIWLASDPLRIRRRFAAPALVLYDVHYVAPSVNICKTVKTLARASLVHETYPDTCIPL